MASHSPAGESMRSWSVPQTLSLRDVAAAYQGFLEYVNVVEHGEFEEAAHKVVSQSKNIEDMTLSRPTAIAIQRCRRGGKTFMLHGVAALLQEMAHRAEQPEPIHSSHVILISLNGTTPFSKDRDTSAYQAITCRVAWELCGRQGNFRNFQRAYNDFGAVDEWLTDKDNRVMLLIDELNVIPPAWQEYGDMSQLIGHLVQQDGCAVLYSTHQRSTEDLLRGRAPGGPQALDLSRRKHEWARIPRIETVECVQGLIKRASWQPSFWCAVLRGRIPALFVQSGEIESYAQNVMQESADGMSLEEERSLCLSAVISGSLDLLPNMHNMFRAYSYMSERFRTDTGKACFAWPPFMIAQTGVLGKDYQQLRATLENPSIDESKAFEALIQLAVLVRLMAKKDHPLVPCHPSVRDSIAAQQATEMLHVGASAKTLKHLLSEVKARFKEFPQVVQVVAVPMFASFPTYDFFLLHREEKNWKVVVGYQCKQSSECPSEDAWQDVPTSLWIEGKCRLYRVQDDGQRVGERFRKGWTLLSASYQADVFGISVAEALPQDPASSHENRLCCKAEQAWNRQHGDSKIGTKRQRGEDYSGSEYE
jgi:hypothetical protein